MRSSHQSPDVSRFATDPRVRSLLAEAQDQLHPLNNDLASESTAFNGIVYYGMDRHHKHSADTLLSLDAPGVPLDRNEFRRRNIDGHRIDLAATALGTTLRDQKSLFVGSRMKASEHMTWGHASNVDERVVGATQFAFSVADGVLPSNRIMDTLWDKHSPTLDEVAHQLDTLAHSTHSLGDSLELLPPATPNAFVIRWDIVNSTDVATSEKYGALRSYQAAWQEILGELIKTYSSTLTSEGDGQNIVIPLAPSVDPNNPTDIRIFARQRIAPLIQNMQSGHDPLLERFGDLNPRIRLSVGLGHLEEDLDHTLTGPTMWEVGSLMKHSPNEPVTYTEAADDALHFNKKTS